MSLFTPIEQLPTAYSEPTFGQPSAENLRGCLDYYQNELGLPAQDAQALCTDYAPITEEPTDFWFHWWRELPQSVGDAPQVLEDAARRAGGIVGTGVGTAVQTATGGTVQSLLILVAVLAGLYVVSRVV